MVLFPVAIAVGHAPGVSTFQTIGAVNLVSIGAALALTRRRPNAQSIRWTMAFVVLLGYVSGEIGLGIAGQSPG